MSFVLGDTRQATSHQREKEGPIWNDDGDDDDDDDHNDGDDDEAEVIEPYDGEAAHIYPN